MQEEHLLVAALSGALIVFSGALYALLFALGRLHHSRMLTAAGYLSYAVLALSSVSLSTALGLHGMWRALIAIMLIGYLLAPRAVWYLCVGTHGEADPQ